MTLSEYMYTYHFLRNHQGKGTKVRAGGPGAIIASTRTVSMLVSSLFFLSFSNFYSAMNEDSDSYCSGRIFLDSQF